MGQQIPVSPATGLRKDILDNNLSAGTNVEIVDGKISVSNTSGVQTTVFAFGKGIYLDDGTFILTEKEDNLSIIQFEDGETIDIPDLINKGWEIVDAALDSDDWTVSDEINRTLQRTT